MREIPGLLTIVDGPAIDDAVDAIVMRRKLEKELTDKKVPMVDPEYKPVMAWKYLKELKDREHKLLSELGLNPFTRKSIHVEKGNLHEDLERRGESSDTDVIYADGPSEGLDISAFGDDKEVMGLFRAFTGQDAA